MKREKQFQPSLQRLLEYQDYLAGLMVRMGNRAHKAAPLWHALQRMIDAKQQEQDAVTAARAHFRRSSGQTAGRSY